jgi:hypothetical protein
MHFSPAEEQERFAIQVFYIGRNVVETIYDGIVHEENALTPDVLQQTSV